MQQGSMNRQRRPRTSSGELLRGVTKIDFKNVEILERFLEDGGRIRSRRRTRTSAKVQRSITVAIKRARHIGLLPYTVSTERSAYGDRSRRSSDRRPMRSERSDDGMPMDRRGDDGDNDNDDDMLTLAGEMGDDNDD